VCLVDTDGDPDLVNIPIPGNDDSMRTIDIVIRELCDAVKKGKEGRSTSAGEAPEGDKAGGREMRGEGPSEGAPTRRRSTRSRYSASASGGPSAPASGDSAQ
jgi:small subunit ribosomal protein S2